MFKAIKNCRICNNENLVEVLNLGEQALTGIFPKSREQAVDLMPLVLVKCSGEGDQHCGLLQLKHTGDLSQMYGESYGYRSGLNASMVKHLHNKVRRIESLIQLQAGDVVVDIGSNDGTTLSAYPVNLKRIGVDPTGTKFKKYYPAGVELLPDFFSARLLKSHLGSKSVRVMTSFSMFYDLENPMQFMQEIYDCLADDGIWVFEQSYMPTMLEMNSYDTICHEHLEYYGLHQIKWMADHIGFSIQDVEFNDINGGSFSVTVTKKKIPLSPAIQKILDKENDIGLHTLRPYQEFCDRVAKHREHFRAFLQEARKKGSRILGYGASTKGNVILQYCQISPDELPCIAEVNEDKFGAYTPGTLIPIVSEAEAAQMNPDYYLVLPWHFRKNILAKEKAFLSKGGKLLFPLPSVEVADQP